MTATTFRDRLRSSRPDVFGGAGIDTLKRDLALALRAMRKDRGLTQSQLAAASGLKQAAISRLESPGGPLPRLETMMRYVDGCGGHLSLAFSALPFQAVAEGAAPRRGAPADRGRRGSRAPDAHVITAIAV